MKQLQYNLLNKVFNENELRNLKYQIIDWLYSLEFLQRITKVHYRKWEYITQILRDKNITIYLKPYRHNEKELYKVENFNIKLKDLLTINKFHTLEEARKIYKIFMGFSLYKIWIVQEIDCNKYIVG